MPVQRIFISEAGRIGVGTYAPHDPTTADIADLVGSVDLSKVAEFGDEGDPRAWSWSGAVYRREPRHARDDRDPQGEARVPLPAAHAHAGEERQGVALPADPPRRDHPRAHQPRRVPQVPAGAGERGAARPHGHHPGALHARLQGRGAHLPQALLLHARRSARCTSTRTRCTSPRCSRCSRASPKARGARRRQRRRCACTPARTSKASRRAKRRRCAPRIPTRAWPASRRASSSTRSPTPSSSRRRRA